MAQPHKLRIAYEANDYGRFNRVGRLTDGTQFIAFVTGAFPTGLKYYSGEDWQQKKRWLAVVHRFDAYGNHVDSESIVGGFDIEDREGTFENAYHHLDRMCSDLCRGTRPELCDVWVKLFSVEIDGVTHGLFYEQSETERDLGKGRDEWVMFEPQDIMFHPPWDSSDYST